MLEELRPGRFGPSYRGRDESTGLAVALKIVDQPLDPEQVEVLASVIDRLRDAPLQHPSIVPILAAGADGRRVWIAEPWFGAPALDGLMRRDGARPIADVLFRVTQLAAALDFAAAVGLHHGALHPRDILAGDDRTVLSGIGVLQAFGDAGIAVPMEGAYVSPQRQQGLPATAADDVFALAWIAYELVCGTPLAGRSELRCATAAIAGVDQEALADVIERALSADVEARYPSALEFAAALQAVATPADEDANQPAADEATLRDAAPPVRIWESSPEPDIPIRPSEAAEVVAPIRVRQDSPPAADLPLRADDRPRPADPAPVAPVTAAVRTGRRPSQADSSRDYGYWFPITATLAIGLLMGFASGYVVGQRERIPAPHAAQRAVAPPEQPAAEVRRNDAAPAPAPAPTGGRAYTDSEVQPEASAGEPSPSAPPPASPPTGNGGEATPVERPDPTAPGVLQVDSRPQGARVFLDGRLVGRTPLVVPDVRPGPHAVRIDLAGHRRWVTTVDVVAGERQRVAASLER